MNAHAPHLRVVDERETLFACMRDVISAAHDLSKKYEEQGHFTKRDTYRTIRDFNKGQLQALREMK